MKKILLTVIITISGYYYAYSQTNTFPSNGNVGIGTTNPQEKLEVTGNQKLFGDLVFGSDKTAYFIHGPGNGGAIRFRTNIVEAIDRNVQIGIIDNMGVWNSFMTVDQNGNTGIGTTSPAAKLSITQSGAEMIGSSLSNLFRISAGAIGNNQNDEISLGSLGYSGSSTNYISLGIRGIRLNAGNSYSNTAVVLGLDVDNTIREGGFLSFRQGGNVGVGVLNPDQKLSVKGTIHSQAVQVDINGWSDYVFKPSYKLASLKDVKTYIDKNHHLPEIPSAGQVAKDGINLGEMNAKLLKKIEELTLYLIEKDKELSKEKLKNEIQQKQLNKINKKLHIN